MNIKARVKSLEEIQKCGELYEGGSYYVRYSNGEPGFVFIKAMQKHCGKIIEIEKWNGNQGFFDDYLWTPPMLTDIEIEEYNENEVGKLL